ncbi:MAG: sulfite exporter TauE/SafE family protein [Verrucomicrobiota bacterium]
MIDATINSAAAAFVAGLVTSVHCVGMCGPVACLSGIGSGGSASAILYHGGRLASYTVIGAAAGRIGEAPLEAVFTTPAVVLPWFLVLVLAAVGLGIEKVLPRPPMLSRWVFRGRMRISSLPVPVRGVALGLMTPLFPCAPLYTMFGIALVSGSAMAGAEFTAAFVLGTVPLLWIGQQPMQWLGGRLSPKHLTHLYRLMALATAAILAFRLRGTLWFYETASAAAVPCPLCLDK